MWWDSDPAERYWVEIRREPGIGISLNAPVFDKSGHKNGWYELLTQLKPGDVVYHYNANESRFVGRSLVAKTVSTTRAPGDYFVPLRGFEPIVAPVGLSQIRAVATAIYNLRDQIEAAHSGPYYLPFQFTTDHSNLRMMSNYFAKMPASLVELLFGPDGLAESALPEITDRGTPGAEGGAEIAAATETLGFLNPFRSKADTDYAVKVIGGRQKRTRKHETLVNECSNWLKDNGFETGRNAAIDLGVVEPPIIIEAKIFTGSWPNVVRAAVGQLYEYRFFSVCDPDAGLIFLVDAEPPAEWIDYLHEDRDIGIIWRKGRGPFNASELAKDMLGI